MEKITLRVCECDAYKDRTGSVMKAAATLGTTPRPPSMRTTAGQAGPCAATGEEGFPRAAPAPAGLWQMDAWVLAEAAGK